MTNHKKSRISKEDKLLKYKSVEERKEIVKEIMNKLEEVHLVGWDDETDTILVSMAYKSFCLF
jgi:hypothetical protein